VTKLRAALVGLGIMGANHARILSNLDGVDLIAVADPQGDTRGTLPGKDVLTSVDEVIKKKVDYCVIAAPTAYHEEISLKLIDAGIHILIEKPIAHTFESANRITKAASIKGVIGAVGHIERFNSALQQTRTRIQNGDLGEIYQISTRRLGPFPARIADVGVVMDLATHDIDLTSWIAGSQYLNVSAQSATRSGRQHEDLVAVVAQLKNGVVVNHLVNWLSPLKERKTIITGQKGTFVVDTLTSDLTFYANGTVDVAQEGLAHFKGVSQGNIQIFAFEKPEPLKVEHENFRDAILGKKSEMVTLESGCTTVGVAEAVIESYEKQGTIYI
jgi:UDP-N-acetylglucosamine 3-dehydrogenase